MDIASAGSALSNPTRVRLLSLLADQSMTAIEAHEAYIRQYDQKARESIYRELEKLVKSNLVDKKYDKRNKELVYTLQARGVCIDFVEPSIRVVPHDD